MSKQQDLITVFNFLAEYLREEPTHSTEPIKEAVGVNITEPEKPLVLGVPSEDILDLMKKVDIIEKTKLNFDEPFLRKMLPEDERDSENKVVEKTR